MRNTYAGPITITGGIVTAIGGPKGAGIGSGWLLPSYEIKIMGGTVTAAGFDGGAGIGGGNVTELNLNLIYHVHLLI